jgi:hypothetical protein
MNFFITIIIYKLFLIRIKPLTWYVIPTWHTDGGIGSGSRDVWVKVPSSKSEDGFVGKWFRRSYRKGKIINWLCLELQFTFWQDTEVADVYPAKYKCGEDPAWREKYEQLCETDCFN